MWNIDTKTIIDKHLICIEIMEGIQSFQIHKHTMEQYLEQGSIYWSFPSLVVKYQHNIDIYERCIKRLLERYNNAIGTAKGMAKILRYNDITI